MHPCPLAAQIARIIALMALAELGLSGAPFHEPFHVQRPVRPIVLLLCVTSLGMLLARISARLVQGNAPVWRQVR
jgi:hypothetical protein